MSLHQETAMQSLRTTAGRFWPIPAAAVISLTLFWAIAFGAQQLMRWLLTHAVGHHTLFSAFLREAAFFATFIPSMVIVGKQQTKKQAQRKQPRRDWSI